MNTLKLPTIPLQELTPSSDNLVLLPEINYKIPVSREIAIGLVSSYAPLLTLPKYSRKSGPFLDLVPASPPSAVSIEPLETLKLAVSKSKSDLGVWSQRAAKNAEKTPWMALVVLLNQDPNCGTLCIISDALDKGETVTISLRALGRAHVVKPTDKLSVSECSVLINEDCFCDALNVEEFSGQISTLFTSIRRFLGLYKKTGNSKDSSAFGVYLKTSPLAAVLYFLLSKSASLQAVERVFYTIFSKETKNEKLICALMLKIYDLLVGILPVSGSIKSSFLAEFDTRKRLDLGAEIVGNFISILTSFEESYESIMKDFMTSQENNNDKLKLMMNHVSNLKSVTNGLGDVKPKGFTHKEIKDAPDIFQEFYKKLVMENSPIKIPLDGAKTLKKDFEAYFRMAQNPMGKNSLEFQVLTNYLEVVLDLPFEGDSFKSPDLDAAQKQLDKDHYGLTTVKKRLLEYLGVIKLGGKTVRPPILCLAGPPGVGKTSLAKSIAATLGRKFQRLSLGGISDESEIRGHRRTYVGSMPGLFVGCLRKAHTLSPVILLDEIDKISLGNIRGNPQAAMLEVLDPEQNGAFTDRYLGFPIDLSQALFLCTANDISTLHPALRDRMEIINVPGYTFMDKVAIVEGFLLAKQTERNCLPKDSVKFDSSETIRKLVVEHTAPEAGIRGLERQILRICRQKALEYTKNKNYKAVVTGKDLPKYLGVARTQNSLNKSSFSQAYGVVNGLSYNSSGTGGVLVFETIAIPSKDPKVVMTGKLGQVLTESVRLAVLFVRLVLAQELVSASVGCSEALAMLDLHQVHLHAPEGAVSKDGPSAGVAITMALFSLVLKLPVPESVAMTGEMTLRGVVLPIGGVREKLLGAHLKGVKDVYLPRENKGDVEEYYKEMGGEKNHSEGPEEYVLQTLGVRVHYMGEIWDVMGGVWGDLVGKRAVYESVL